MPSAVCRCGKPLHIPDRATDRVVCPHCNARVRIRHADATEPPPDDGFIRFYCPCGRRLKVPAAQSPTHGKCPECGKVVPVPKQSASGGLPAGHPETPTQDLSPADLAALERWSKDHATRAAASQDHEPGVVQFVPAGRPPRAPGAGDQLPATVAIPARSNDPLAPEPPTKLASGPPARIEAGLRLCPKCRRPVHLQAQTCGACGAAVPRR